MTLKDYFQLRKGWLEIHRHPKTVNETRVAVEAFCDWVGSDPDISKITPDFVGQFEADKASSRRRQLVSNLRGLLRLNNPKAFPRKDKTMFAMAMSRKESIVKVKDRHPGQIRSLSEFAEAYVSQRAICDLYSKTIVKRAQRYEQWHETVEISALFTEERLNHFLAALDGTGSPYTVIKWRQDLLTLWSAAADDDLCPYPMRRRIRKAKCDPISVECYTADEVRLLIAAAGGLSGGFNNGVARRHYWRAIIRFAWDTGLRRGDCWQFDRASLQSDGTFRQTQHKTRKPIRRMLRPDTVAAIGLIKELEKPLDWPLGNEWSFGFNFQRLVAQSGIERGSFKWLRRATGSQVEALQPGGGHKALGNTQQVFRTHYDADVAGEVLMPPAL